MVTNKIEQKDGYVQITIYIDGEFWQQYDVPNDIYDKWKLADGKNDGWVIDYETRADL